jgi:hypothetical protein
MISLSLHARLIAKIRALENSLAQDLGMNDFTGTEVAKMSSHEGIAKSREGGAEEEEGIEDVEGTVKEEDERERGVETSEEDEDGIMIEGEQDVKEEEEMTGLHFL